MKNFAVGFARRVITPHIGTRLFGYPVPHNGEVVHDDLNVNVLALKQEDITVLLVSVDLCTLGGTLADDLRDLLAKENGIPKNHIIAAAIHTHSGPATSSSAGWGNANTEYIADILLPRAAEAAKEALQNLAPAEMGIGETESKVGINRREPLPDGIITLGQNPDGPYDPRMRVLAFRSPEGKPIASLVHYGCHATAIGNTNEISRDWPGFMIDMLEEETGAPAVFFNGCIGDVGPRVRCGKTIGDMEQAQEVGEMGGRDAIRAYQGIERYQVPQMQVKSDDLKLPYVPLLTAEEAEAGIKNLGDPSKLQDTNITLYDKYEKILEFHKSGKTPETEWVYPQTYLALDSVVFVPYPFEAFSEIFLNQQKDSPFTHTLCLTNCNGSMGYLPTKTELPKGGYEVNSFYAHFYLFEDDADKQIVAENKRLLESLFA